MVAPSYPVSPASALTAAIPSITPAEMQILVSRTGLVLNPGQLADLVLAWRQLAGLIASVPRDRPLGDDMALVFKPEPPARSPALPSQPPLPSQVAKKPAARAAAKR